MKIRVTFDNYLLGKGVFWEGLPGKLEEIQNMAARIAAKKTRETGEKVKFGMWTSEVVGEKGEENEEDEV